MGVNFVGYFVIGVLLIILYVVIEFKTNIKEKCYVCGSKNELYKYIKKSNQKDDHTLGKTYCSTCKSNFGKYIKLN